MEWLPFILALAFGREHAIIVARASDLSSVEALLLTAGWYLALGCLTVYFLDRPAVARKLAKLQDTKLCRRIIGRITPPWRGLAVFVLCFVPNGFWVGILLMTLWKYRWYQRVLLVTAGNVASYLAYEAAMAPVLGLFGSYLLLTIPTLLLVGLVVKERSRFTTVRNWSTRRYRLIFSKAVS